MSLNVGSMAQAHLYFYRQIGTKCERMFSDITETG